MKGSRTCITAQEVSPISAGITIRMVLDTQMPNSTRGGGRGRGRGVNGGGITGSGHYSGGGGSRGN